MISLIYIGYQRSSDNKARVILIHNYPDLLPQEMIEQGTLVEFIPEPEQMAGKQAELFINPQTKELWYEYVEIHLPEEQLF